MPFFPSFPFRALSLPMDQRCVWFYLTWLNVIVRRGLGRLYRGVKQLTSPVHSLQSGLSGVWCMGLWYYRQGDSLTARLSPSWEYNWFSSGVITQYLSPHTVRLDTNEVRSCKHHLNYPVVPGNFNDVYNCVPHWYLVSIVVHVRSLNTCIIVIQKFLNYVNIDK